MGQCGCGGVDLTEGFWIEGSDLVIAVGAYDGCKDCETPVSHQLYVFTPRGWAEHGRGLSVHRITPDDLGGVAGDRGAFGVFIPIIGREDLLAAVEGEEEVGAWDFMAYGSASQFMREWGFRLLQDAFVLAQQRWRDKLAGKAAGGEG